MIKISGPYQDALVTKNITIKLIIKYEFIQKTIQVQLFIDNALNYKNL